MNICIVIPAHNEEKRIAPTLKSYSDYFENLRDKEKIDYTILVVINATADKTENVVLSLKKKNKRISYINLKKGGKGYAVIEGFKNALKRKSDLIGFVDADGATPPQAFHILVKEIKGADGAIASRYIRGSITNPPPSFIRLCTSRLYNLLIRSLFFMPYRDTQCGAKLFNREPLAAVISSLTMHQWAFDVELLYRLRRKGYLIKEVPTIWGEKTHSKIRVIRSGLTMALGIINLRLANSKFKRALYLYNRIKKRIIIFK